MAKTTKISSTPVTEISQCTGKPCSQIRFVFESADLENLKYVFTNQAGQESEGTLEEGNEDYIAAWFASLVFRLLFGPFSGFSSGCSDGCDCLLGPEFSEVKTYSHVFDTKLKFNQSIKITGSFKMNVFVRTGVCVPANGTTFARAKFAGVPGLLAETALSGDDPAIAIADKC